MTALVSLPLLVVFRSRQGCVFTVAVMNVVLTLVMVSIVGLAITGCVETVPVPLVEGSKKPWLKRGIIRSTLSLKSLLRIWTPPWQKHRQMSQNSSTASAMCRFQANRLRGLRLHWILSRFMIASCQHSKLMMISPSLLPFVSPTALVMAKTERVALFLLAHPVMVRVVLHNTRRPI